MKLGKVTGNLVSTHKNEALRGKKFLWVEPLSAEGKPEGEPVLALDSIGAGWGETVIYVTAKEAAWPFLPEQTPSDCTIVGIVDRVNIATEQEKE